MYTPIMVSMGQRNGGEQVVLWRLLIGHSGVAAMAVQDSAHARQHSVCSHHIHSRIVAVVIFLIPDPSVLRHRGRETRAQLECMQEIEKVQFQASTVLRLPLPTNTSAMIASHTWAPRAVNGRTRRTAVSSAFRVRSGAVEGGIETKRQNQYCA